MKYLIREVGRLHRDSGQQKIVGVQADDSK